MTPSEPEFPAVDLKQIGDFFRAVFPNARSEGRLCVGALPSKDELKQADEYKKQNMPVPRSLKAWWQFFGKADKDTLKKFLMTQGQAKGLHMRQTRFAPDANRGLPEHVTEATHLWLDIDVKNHKELYIAKHPDWFSPGDDVVGKLIDYCAEALEKCALPPTVIVESGGGVHAYWTLKESVIDAAGLEAVKRANIQLCRIFGGDAGATSINDPLRLPGTTNFNYTPARPCRLLTTYGQQHALVDLSEWVVQQTPLFGPGCFDLGEHDAYIRYGMQMMGGAKKAARSREEWAEILKDLAIDGRRRNAALALSGKLTTMGKSFDEQWAVFKNAGCTLDDFKLRDIIQWTVNKHGARNAEGAT